MLMASSNLIPVGSEAAQVLDPAQHGAFPGAATMWICAARGSLPADASSRALD
jgi:hypothetical protein